MIVKSTRKIRLCRKHLFYKTSRQGKIVPWLNVSGKWLQQAGFHPGDHVEITIDQRLLIIKNLTE